VEIRSVKNYRFKGLQDETGIYVYHEKRSFHGRYAQGASLPVTQK
jgi:hypothetical protein